MSDITLTFKVFTVTMVKYKRTKTVEVIILHVVASDKEHAYRRAIKEEFFGVPLTVFEGAHKDELSLLPPIRI